MKAITSRLTSAILGCVFCAAFSNGVAAEEVGSAPPSPGACPAAATGFADPMSVPHWNGWGVDSSQRRFQSAEMAQLAAEDVPRLKLKWAFGFPGANFAAAQPTVLGGRVFVGSQGGKRVSAATQITRPKVCKAPTISRSAGRPGSPLEFGLTPGSWVWKKLSMRMCLLAPVSAE